LMYDRAAGEYRQQDRHLWEPFLHKITNGVFAIRTLERHKFDRSADTQRLSVTGPPPTCPFILKPTMSKSRRASSPGSIRSGHRLHRLRRGAKRTRDLRGRPRPLAGGAYMWGLPTRQPGFLHLCCNFPIGAIGRRPKP
jgi:hypothetical protein